MVLGIGLIFCRHLEKREKVRELKKEKKKEEKKGKEEEGEERKVKEGQKMTVRCQLPSPGLFPPLAACPQCAERRHLYSPWEGLEQF